MNNQPLYFKLRIVVIVAMMFLLVRWTIPAAELKDVAINAGVQDGKARLVIEGFLNGIGEEKTKVLFATSLEQTIRVTRENEEHIIKATFDILQGEPKELT